MMHYWSYGPGYSRYGTGFNLFSFILTVLFWWLIIMLIVKLFKWVRHNHYEGCAECHNRRRHSELMNEEEESVDNSNTAIVKERYAKGEINKKEFEQLMKDLS